MFPSNACRRSPPLKIFWTLKAHCMKPSTLLPG
jgi:hypothetical protein